MKQLSSYAAVATIAAVLSNASSAGAWESEKRTTTHVFPLHPGGLQHPSSPQPDPKSLNGMLRYGARRLHTTLGGLDPEGSDDVSRAGIYVCQEGFLNGGDLSRCRMATRADMERRGLGWIKAREATSSDARDGEHVTISRAAAAAAGLLETSLFDRFWLRYPSQNAYVASRIDPSNDPNAFTHVAAQSLGPTSWGNMGTQAVRGISLLELIELPDFSHSAADWILGNEECLVQGTEDAYFGVDHVNGCHEYGLTLGALNATHFAPLNRRMYDYYHALAKRRMTACAELLPLIQSHYEFWNDSNPNFIARPWSSRDTEAHECEREAFVYEMIAQHFLQDAWSTGHMWKRWGHANFAAFPSGVELPFYDDTQSVLPANEQARRAAIALSVALLSGTVHGAKSVVYNLARKHLGPEAAGILESRGVLNDPLSGPTYTLATPSGEPQRGHTSWTTGALVHPGAGDMFWDAPAARVASDPVYEEQRTRLLGCSVGSMLDVYRTPAPNGDRVTRAHGAPGVQQILAFDASSDACWDHWATNGSMLGALGVFDLLNFFYRGKLVPGSEPRASAQNKSALVMGLVNQIGLVDRFAKPNFPPGELAQATTEAEAERIEDRDTFFKLLSAKVNLDFLRISEAYLENYNAEPEGVRSAHGLDPEGELVTLLGVPPAGGSAAPHPAHVDPEDFSLGPTRRAFWRADLQNVCVETAENGAAVLHDLRERCMESAEFGGDPDACTACVDLAELHIPTCVRVNPADTFQSKCSAVGAESISFPPPGLPAWWFDIDDRTRSGGPPLDSDGTAADEINCGFPSYQVALHWCTGTASMLLSRGSLRGARELQRRAEPDVCGRAAASWTQRVGVSALEVNGINSPEHGRVLPFMRPLVSAFVEDIKSMPTPDCNSPPRFTRESSSRDAQVSAALAPLPLWDNEAWGVRALNFGQEYQELKVPQCGVTQRTSWWNRDCATAFAQLRKPQPAADWIPETGELFTPIGPNTCWVRERRELVPNCPAPMACNAGSVCVPTSMHPDPGVTLLDLPETP